MRLLDEKGDVKLANGRVLAEIHSALGGSLIDEAARLGAANAQKLRVNFPQLAQ